MFRFVTWYKTVRTLARAVVYHHDYVDRLQSGVAVARLQSGVAVAEHLVHPEAGERPRQEDHLADREQEDHLADMERQKNPHHRDKHLHQTRPLSCVGTVVALKELLRDPTL